MRKLLAATLLLASTLAIAYPLAASAGDAPSCGDAQKTFHALKEKFKQSPVAGGQISEKVILVIFATGDASQWSAWAVDSEGHACPLSAGIGWSQSAPGQAS